MVDFLTGEQRTAIIELYIAYFNRAPEFSGLDYHAEAVLDDLNAGLDFQAALNNRADNFFSAAVDLGVYSSAMTAEEFVATVYENTLLRPGVGGDAPTDAEISYWTAKLASGEVQRGDLVTEFLDSIPFLLENGTAEEQETVAQVQAVLENRIEVAEVFATQEVSGGLEGQAAIDAGEAAIAGVTADDASVQDAIEELQEGADIGETFTLTDAVGEQVTGGADNNVISGVADAGATSTFNVGDQVDGGAGFDTFNLISDTGAVPAGASVTNIERVNLNLTADGQAVDTGDFGDDVEQFWLEGSYDADVEVAGGTLGFANNEGNPNNQTTNVSASGSLNLAVSNLSNTVSVNAATTAGAAALTSIAIFGETDGGDIVLGDAAGTSVTNLELLLDGDVDIDAKASNATTDGMGNLETVDASASSGDLMIDVDGNGGVDVIGGTGNDYIILGATFDIDTEIDGGEGQDTLQIASGGTIASPAALIAQDYLALNAVENVEELYLNDTTVVDVSRVDSISTFGFERGGTATEVTDDTTLIAGGPSVAEVATTSAEASTLIVEHADSTDDAAAGTVNLMLEDQATITVDNNEGAVDNGFAQLVVSGNGQVFFDNSDSNADNAAAVIDVSGAALLDADDEIDTANFTSDITLATEVAETVILGEGRDTVDAQENSTFANMDIVENFTSEGDLVDLLELDDSTGSAAFAEYDVQDGDSLNESFVGALAQSGGDESYVYFNYEGNTYVVADGGGAGNDGAINDDDFAIQIVGTHDLADGTNVDLVA